MMRASVSGRWFGLSVFIGLAACGCHKPAAPAGGPVWKTLPAPATTAENGWPLYEVPAEGFAIALPPDWVHIDASPQALDNMARGVTANNPGMKSMAETIREQVKTGTKFFGFDKEAAATGRGTNVAVGKGKVGPGATLKSMVDLNVQQLQHLFKLPGTIKRETRHTAVHGEAERLDLLIQLNGPNGSPMDLACTQYYFLDGTDNFVVNFTTTPDKLAQYGEIATTICESFRLLKR
jgi:hypothetical protein